MASSFQKKEDLVAECVICYEIYKEPKMLISCGHSFCAQCIKNIPGYGKLYKKLL